MLSHFQKGTLSLMHQGCVLQRVSLGALSDEGHGRSLDETKYRINFNVHPKLLVQNAFGTRPIFVIPTMLDMVYFLVIKTFFSSFE